MTIFRRKGLAMDGRIYSGQINTLIMKEWLNLTQYPSVKSYCYYFCGIYRHFKKVELQLLS